MGGNKSCSAHLFGIRLFALGVRDGCHVGSKRLCEEETKVAQAAYADDSDIFGRLASAVYGQGVVQSSASA